MWAGLSQVAFGLIRHIRLLPTHRSHPHHRGTQIGHVHSAESTLSAVEARSVGNRYFCRRTHHPCTYRLMYMCVIYRLQDTQKVGAD